LARTIAVRGATSGPENSTVTGSLANAGRATSAATNSSGTGGLSLSAAPAVENPLPILGSNASTSAATTSSASALPITIRRPRRGCPGAASGSGSAMPSV
jgi:hypothetical protein